MLRWQAELGVCSSTEVASGNTVGLSVIPLIRDKVSSACKPIESDSEELAELKQRILGRLDARFPVNDFIMVAALLDPASKNKKYLNMSMDMKRDKLAAALQVAATGNIVAASVASAATATLLVEDESQNTVDTCTDTPKPKRLRIMDEFEDDNSEDDMMAIITQYLSANERVSDEERADPMHALLEKQ